MATISLLTCCAYLTDVSAPWRPSDFTTNKMVKAIKGDLIKGYFNIGHAGKSHRFDQSNVTAFLPIVHEVMASAVATLTTEKCTLVPIPNSHVVAPSTPGFRIRALTDGIAARNPIKLSSDPALVFVAPQPKSHGGGGSRDPEHLESVMRLDHVPAGPVILVDDVSTSGSHFVAAARKLRAAGVTVAGALAFAKASPEPADNVLQAVMTELDLDPPVLDLSLFF